MRGQLHVRNPAVDEKAALSPRLLLQYSQALLQLFSRHQEKDLANVVTRNTGTALRMDLQKPPEVFSNAS
jgi:hypothetical protein